MRGPSLLSALLQCYPRAFRERYAREVEESTRVLLQRAWQRGPAAGLRMTLSVIVDLIRSISTERRLSRLREDAPRDGRWGMGGASQDVRAALRQIPRNPGFAAAVVLTLSLGMGGLAAVFTIADPVLFRPLPYPEADRIVTLHAVTDRGQGDLFSADFVRLEEDGGPFQAVTKFGVSLLGILDRAGQSPVRVFLDGVSRDFFDVFRVEPAIGRRFIQSDPDDGVAIITHDVWQRDFHARPDIVGQPFVLRRSRPRTLEIIGVLPAGFMMPPELRPIDSAGDVFVGLTKASVTAREATSARTYASPFARLRPGVTHDEALTALGRVMTIVEGSSPDFAAAGRRRPAMEPLVSAIYPGARSPMFMLLAVAAFVVILACANLAHLFMAQFAGRAAELATRVALGASRARLARLLVLEAAVLTTFGAAGALFVAQFLKDAVVRMLPASSRFEALAAAEVDGRVLAFVAISMLIALLGFGVVPAAAAVRGELHSRMKLSRAHGAGSRVRSGLVLTQTATAVAVLLTALLLAASFMRLVQQDLGFDPHGVQALSIVSPVNVGPDNARKRHTNVEMRRRIAALNGGPVALAGGIPGSSLPTGVGRVDVERRAFRIIGYPVSAEFFAVFDIHLMRGRLMTADEGLSGASVIVVDERAAALTWPGQDPIGKPMRDAAGVIRYVIGVVRTLRTRVIEDRFERPAAFFPLPAEHTGAYTMLWRGPTSESFARNIQSEMRSVDPQATALIEPLRIVEWQLEGPRFLAILLGALGALATALTVVGLYGVVSHGVAQRTREMGIRIALGAEAARIARMIVTQTLRPAAIGVALGLALSLWWTETLRAMLHGVSPHDWRVFAVAGASVLALVGLACVLPIRRATRVDPLIALKTE